MVPRNLRTWSLWMKSFQNGRIVGMKTAVYGAVVHDDVDNSPHIDGVWVGSAAVILLSHCAARVRSVGSDTAPVICTQNNGRNAAHNLGYDEDFSYSRGAAARMIYPITRLVGCAKIRNQGPRRLIYTTYNPCISVLQMGAFELGEPADPTKWLYLVVLRLECINVPQYYFCVGEAIDFRVFLRHLSHPVSPAAADSGPAILPNAPTGRYVMNAFTEHCVCEECTNSTSNGPPNWYTMYHQNWDRMRPGDTYNNQGEGVGNPTGTYLTAPTLTQTQFAAPGVQERENHAPSQPTAALADAQPRQDPTTRITAEGGLRRLADRYINNPGALVSVVRLEPGPSGGFQVVIMVEIANIL
ncbi:hypothetical protein EI94DRAFT_1700869 [Lactarius quietus]|nr:hypothetical protein EI94DRAFT_1700869 [Lactarius quietus]